MKNKEKIALLLVTTSILLNGCALDKGLGFNTNKKTPESKTTITMEDVEDYLEQREKKEKHKHRRNKKEEEALYERVADEVIAGYWGNGEQRKQALINAGFDYERVRAIVNRKIAEREQAQTQQTQEDALYEKVADEVIAGNWGNGEQRKQALINAGYDYEKVRSIVNRKIAEREQAKSLYTGVVGYANEDTQLFNAQFQPVAVIDKYQKVFIYNDAYNNCVHVSVPNIGEGYMYIPHLTQMPNTYVEVDISDQKVYMYKDGQLVLNADVITGRDNYETDLGYTEVSRKYYNVIDQNTQTQSDYYIQFNDSVEGFNDADCWRRDSEYNDKTAYRYNGSNGCVNMKQNDIEILNYYTEIGTKVLIHK